MKGKFIIFPMANPLAFDVRQRRTPVDRKDMNRCWPGKKNGTVTERMCWQIFEKLKECDYILDLHNCSQYILNVPQARVEERLLSKELKVAYEYLNLPFAYIEREAPEGSLSKTCSKWVNSQ